MLKSILDKFWYECQNLYEIAGYIILTEIMKVILAQHRWISRVDRSLSDSIAQHVPSSSWRWGSGSTRAPLRTMPSTGMMSKGRWFWGPGSRPHWRSLSFVRPERGQIPPRCLSTMSYQCTRTNPLPELSWMKHMHFAKEVPSMVTTRMLSYHGVPR